MYETSGTTNYDVQNYLKEITKLSVPLSQTQVVLNNAPKASPAKQCSCNKNQIKSMTVNPAKRIVTVVFADGDVRMSKCNEADIFDEYVGVAMCLADHLFGTKNKFHKTVKKTAKYV